MNIATPFLNQKTNPIIQKLAQLVTKFKNKPQLINLSIGIFLVFLTENIISKLLFSSRYSISLSDRFKAGFIASVLVFFLHSFWKIQNSIPFLQTKLPLLFNLVLKLLRKIATFVSSQFITFKTASNRQRWMLVRKPLAALIVLLLVYTFGSNLLPPKIATSFPGNQSVEAPLDSKVEIIFDTGVVRTLAEKSFTISPKVDGKFSWEGDQKLIFTPQEMLERGTNYTIHFKGVVLSKLLVPIISNKTISFETIGNPKVILASPQNEALEDFTPITVVFDRPIIALTTATNSAIKQPAFTVSPEIKGEGKWLGTTAYQFRPLDPFKKATTYSVTVPSGIQSQDLGVLQEEYNWTFSSERPHVDDVSPKHEYSYASTTASVSATFNQLINPKSVTDRFAVYDKDKNKIPGRVQVSGKTIGFFASQPLKRSMRYTAVISQGIEGMEGPNGMEDEYSWSFKVTAKPAAISSTPTNGAKDIREEYRMEVFFETPMDEDSFENNVSIEPKPDIKPSLYFSSYGTRHSLSISTFLGRSQTYTITIGAGVKDQYGTPLGSNYTFSFSTAAYKPSVSIYPSGTYFGAFNQEVIPRIVSQVINANQVDYSLYKLSRDQLLDLYRKRYENQCSTDACRNWQNYDVSTLEKVRSWSETYEADFNTPVHVITKVTKEGGENIPAGFYFLDLHIPQGARDNMVMIVSKSTLTVKKSDKQIFTWAVNQSTSDVVSGMTMQLTDSSGTVLADGTSNNDGVFMKDVDLFQKNNLFIFGQKDDDVVVAASAWSQGINAYDFGLPNYYSANQSSDYNNKQDYKLFLIPDRPIYRPGQKVFFKGVIKKDTDGAYENLKPGEKVLTKITDAQNRSVYSTDLPITTFGSFSGDFDLSKDANLGYYQISSTFQGTTYSQGFQVEEYKKPDLAVTVKTTKNAYTQGENAGVAINASYYFGAPVSETPVRWVLQTQDFSFRWDKDWRFEFGDPDSYWSRPWWNYSNSSYYSGEIITEGKGKTNSQGDLEFTLPLDISKQKTTQRMLVEATVTDSSNQSIAASQEFTVHKGGVYVGLRPTSYANKSGSEAQVEVVAVDLNGNEIPDTPVSLSFYKRTWETIREKNPNDGKFYYTSKPSDTLVTSVTVKTDSLGRATGAFTPSQGGTYKVVGTVSDKNGNQNTSGSFLWVSGFGFSTARENNDRIVLVTDKRDYLVGENLSVFVASPFASDSAKTLLTAERGTVLNYKVVDTNESSNNFTMDIPPKYTPNAFIGATLVRAGNQVKKPAEFKMGYTEIKVTDKKQQIDVRITTDKKKYKPNETLKATIETKDLLGHPISTELAVGLVDKAVWDIANIEFPDIYKTFYQPRNLEVATSQLLTISIDRINANTNLGAKGGSGGGCFTGDTPILLKGGITKNIEDIQIGDELLTRKSDTVSQLVEATVTKTFKHTVDEYLIINGELRVTPIHRMYVNNQWLIAGEIAIGDQLLNKYNQLVPVFSIERVRGNFDVYNLEVEKYRTYFADGIYVHNQKGGNDTTRSNFPDTAYWNPAVTTNAEGKAEISIPLPDNLTTWRLAAIANSQDAAFGSSVDNVIVSREVLLRPFLPRFLSVGDEAKLGAIIVNTSGETQNLTATIQANGIKITDEASKKIVLADGAQQKITWSTVTSSTSSAKIKVSIAGADAITKDSVEITLPVKSYSIPELVATSGQANDTATEKIVLPKELDKTQGSAAITFSPSLGANSMSALPYLLQYPYFSTENITSRTLPAIFVHRILDKAKLNTNGYISTDVLKNLISDGIQRLNNQQKPDGGWGWWPEYKSDPFLTAYSYSTLAEAKTDSFTVANETLQRAESYLENQLSNGEKYVSLNTQAYILYVLRTSKTNHSAYAANLYTRRFELSLESRAYLAMAMNTMPTMGGKANRLYSELLSLAKKTATTTHWEEPKHDYRYMGSNTTATATVLEALSQFDKNNPLIPEVVRYLMSIRKDNHWSSTRDTAAVIKAITTQLLNKGDEKVNEEFKLELNGKSLLEGSFTKKDLLTIQEHLVSITDLTIGGESELRMTKSGEGNLYYNINLKYYLPFSEITPLEQGIVVLREFVDSKGKILPNDTLTEGTEVWVRLLLVTPEDRHYVVIEDTLPAGLESVNESLKNVSSLTMDQPEVKEEGNQLLYFQHKEYHDDRTTLFANFLPAGVYEVMYRARATTPGRYHHPPAQAYQMNVPDISGHSQGGWLTIK